MQASWTYPARFFFFLKQTSHLRKPNKTNRELLFGIAKPDLDVCPDTHSHTQLSGPQTIWPYTLFSPSTIYILFAYSFRVLVQNRVYILEYGKNMAPNRAYILEYSLYSG